MTLKDTQEQFKKIILEPESLRENMAFVQTCYEGKIPLEKRFEVYRGNLISSLTDVVTSTYELITALTGEDFASSMAREYILQNIPERANMNTYGGTYAEFIESFNPAQSLPYLPDIARLEWAMHLSYYGADEPDIDLTALSEEDNFEILELVLKDHVHLLQSNYPLDQIRNACLDPNQAGTLSLEQEAPSHFLITRPKFVAELEPISKDVYDFLLLIQNKNSLGEIFETFSKKEPNRQPEDLQHILQDLLKKNIFTDYTKG